MEMYDRCNELRAGSSGRSWTARSHWGNARLVLS